MRRLDLKRFLRRLSSSIGISLFLALVMIGVAWAVEVTVDTFDFGSQSLTANGGNPTVYGVASGAGILGGEREVQVEHLGGSGDVAVNIDQGNSDRLEFTQAAGVTARATLRWDGSGDSAAQLNFGLGGIDLFSESNDGFHVSIVAAPQPINVTFRVFSSSTNWSEYTLVIPGGISPGDYVDYLIPFAGPYDVFTQGQGASSEADFGNVAAIEVLIDGTLSAGADLSIAVIESCDRRDYADLPNTYHTILVSNGPRHVPFGLRLGANLDSEFNGAPSANADGDDTTDIGDEDGIQATGNWNDGSGEVTAVVSGLVTGRVACLSAWIDISGSAINFDSADQVVDRVVVNPGVNPLTFTLPMNVAQNTTLNARFRLFPDSDQDGSCSDEPAIGSTGEIFNGEVEDYVFEFTPTAVILTSVSARSASSIWNIQFPALLGLYAIAALFLFRYIQEAEI